MTLGTIWQRHYGLGAELRAPADHSALGAAFAGAGQLEAARIELEEALRLDPRDAKARYLLRSLAAPAEGATR